MNKREVLELLVKIIGDTSDVTIESEGRDITVVDKNDILSNIYAQLAYEDEDDLW